MHYFFVFSLRAIYGTDDQRNALHGSDSFSSSEREIRFFFPDSIIEPIPTGQAAKDYLSHEVRYTKINFFTFLICLKFKQNLYGVKLDKIHRAESHFKNLSNFMLIASRFEMHRAFSDDLPSHFPW